MNLTDGGPRVSDAELDSMASASLGNDFMEGLRSGSYAARGQLHKLAGYAINAAGFDGSEQNAKAAVDSAYSQAHAQDLVPLSGVHDVSSGLRYGAGMLGQAAPMVGAALGAGALTGGAGVVPTLLAGTAAVAPMEIGAQLQRQEQDPANRFATPAQSLRAAVPTGIGSAAAYNLIPAGVASRMIGKAGGGVASRLAGDVVGQGVAAGAAEGIHQVGDNIVNPNAGFDVHKMLEAVPEGMAAGAVFGGLGAAKHVIGSPGRVVDAAKGLVDSAKGLVPDSIKERLQGGKKDVGEAADAAAEWTKDRFDYTAEAAAKAADWAKGKISAKVADVKAWGKEFMDDPAAPESFKAKVQDAINNPGDSAKAAWLATQAFAKEAKAQASAAVEKADIPSRLRALHKDMQDSTKGLMERLSRGEEPADAAEILAAGDDPAKLGEVFDKADQTAAAKVKEWGEQMLNEHLGEEKTAQLKQWLANVGDKASQTGIAGMKVAHDAAKYTADKAQKFAEKAKATEAGAAAQVAAHVVKGKLGTEKKSEALPEGMRERIGEAIMDVLGDDHPLLDSGFVRDRDGQVFTPLQHLADGLRAVMTSAAEGRPVSSDALAQLYDIAGSKTRALIDAVHSAVGEPAADKASFFAAVNAAVDAGKGKDGVIATMQKSLKPELQGSVRPHELKMEAELLREWMTRSDGDKRAGVQKTLSEAEVTHRDALIREALEHRYGAKAEAVLVAIRKEIGKEESLKDSERKTSMDSDDDMRESKDPNAAGEREFNAKDESVRTHYFPQNGQLYLSPEYAVAGQFADAATQRINAAKKENPDANVVFRRVSELDESDPKVKAMVDAKYEDLVDLISNDPNWRDLGDPEDLAAKELEKYGLVVAEQSKQETSISAGELDKLRLDAKKYPDSKSRIDTGVRGEKGNVVIDAIKLTEFMNAKMRDAREYSPIDDLGPGYRDARMFMEGVAAVASRLGRGFRIPDETKITRQGLTWGEARKLDPRTDKDKAYDADSSKLQASDEEFAMASTRRPARKGEQMSFGEKGMDSYRAALEEDIAWEKTHDIRAAREWDLLREQTMDENRMQSTDKTGYEGEVERGIHTEKRAAREELRALEATIAEVGKQLDGEVAFGRDGKEEVALRQQLSWLNTAKDALQARIAKMVPENRPSGRRAIDPFGPTHDALRGSEDGNPIRVNADGSARGDTVMGRRRPAQHDPRAEVLEPAPANAREGKALAAARQRANAPVPIDNEKALGLKLRQLDEVLRKDMTRKEAAALQRVHGMSPEAREELVNHLYDKYVAAAMDPGEAEAAARGGPPSPKAVAAKKAAFLEKTRSGDPELLKTLASSDNAKGLQRALDALKGMKGENVERVIDTINRRLTELIQDQDVRYGLLTKKYSLERGDAAASLPMSRERVTPGAQGPVDRQAVMDYLGRVHGPNVQVAWKNIMHAGEFERTATADVIRLSVHSLNPLSTAYHEALHGFMAKLRDDRHSDIAAVLTKAGESAPVMNQLRKLLANEPDALKQLTDAEERAAYMYQFWAAGKLKLGEKATTIFQRITKFLREVTGMWTNDQRAEKIMEYFHSGEFEQNRSTPSVVHRALMEAGTVRAWEKAKAMTEPLREMGEALASAGGTRLRDTGIPALRELADAMKLKTTTEGADPGYLPAARSERARVMNQIGAELKGYTADQLDQALHQLQTGARSNDVRVRSAAATVSKHLADMLTYMQKAGVQIEHLGMTQGVPYFPRSWDASYISSHQKEFLAMIAKYPEFRGDPHKTMQKLMVTDGAEFGVEVDKPGMQHSKERILSFISHADAAPFMRKDLHQILNSYVSQATRRAEWARRFGDDGKGLQMLLAKARAEGATEAQMDAAQKFVRSVDGTLGDTINPVARRAMGDMLVYQNIRLLPLAIFSSLVDSQGIMVRGGTVGEAFKTFKRGMKEVVKNFQRDPKNDAMTDLAEAIGTVDNAYLVHTLGASHSQGMVGDRGRAINDTFFRLNLMEQYTASMRTGATEAALSFIARHATKPGQHSERFLRELGLEAKDVQIGPHGRPKVLESDGLSLAESAKMKAAVNRWVDGAILRPDAVDKPIWMSDPHYALVAHLKQFVYSFHETILKRVAHEAQHGNFSPAMALASYVPMMLAADTIKGLIQGGGDQPSWKAGWGLGDYLWNASERAGLFGTGQFAIDALGDVQRGGSGVGALTGPTIEQLTDAVRVMGGREHFKTFAVHAMPANTLYNSAFDAGQADPKFAD